MARVGWQVVDVHPEVSFATLAGRFLPEPKTTWAGFDLRRRLLANAGIVLDGDLGLTGRRVSPDDVFDAAVAAWTAERVVRGVHVSLPDPPELLADGRRAAIWYHGVRGHMRVAGGACRAVHPDGAAAGVVAVGGGDRDSGGGCLAGRTDGAAPDRDR